jgi:hypothetical protein
VKRSQLDETIELALPSIVDKERAGEFEASVHDAVPDDVRGRRLLQGPLQHLANRAGLGNGELGGHEQGIVVS